MKNVIIADDHPLVRQGIKRILSYDNEFFVAGEASSIYSLRNLLRTNHADALILDLSMPGIDPELECLKEIKWDYPWIPVLILSTYSEDQYGAAALSAGASGFLIKDRAPEQLVEALREIIIGKNYFGRSG